MSKASGRWILFIDADEEISDELAKELKTLDEGVDAYFLRRRDFWWGKELKYGETAKVRTNGLVRLVKKDSGSWKGPVHEEFSTQGRTSRLEGFINHYPHPSIKDFLNEINFYSTLRAKELAQLHTGVSAAQIILFPVGKFILTYFLRLGFLDGAPGFAYSFFMSFHSFLVRAKLYQYLHFHEKN
jgi:glycosyltransferase involved in cell wall biosynthesis